MKCFRIYATEVETGKYIRKIRIPLGIFRIVVHFLPARVFERIDAEYGIEVELGKALLQALYKILLEVDANREGDIENGLIVDMQEFNEERQGYDQWVVFVE